MVPSVICPFATLIHMTSVSLMLACGGGVSAWSSVPGPGCSEGVLLGFMKSSAWDLCSGLSCVTFHGTLGGGVSWGGSGGHSHSCFLVQLKLEDRSVVPRDVVRHMRSTVSPASHPGGVAYGRSGPGVVVAGAGAAQPVPSPPRTASAAL